MTDHITTMVGAGHDTTAFFASYVCYLLAQHPQCQERLRECVRAVVGAREEVTADDIASMQYLHLFLQETLRFFAVIPFLVRKSSAEFVHKSTDGSPDVVIPADTEVMIPMYLLNRDPAIWDRPTEFDPMRWEGKGEYTSAKDGFFPFGYGTRVCIGNMLAQLEVAVFISQLLRQYRVLPDPSFKLHILAGISLTTSNGVKVKFKKL
jgi:cytochrome P450